MANEAPNQNSIFRTIFDRVWIAIRVGLMGWDGTQGRKVSVDTDGRLNVNIQGGIATAGPTFDDGDAVDTDSQAFLVAGATDIPGTVRVLKVTDDGNPESLGDRADAAAASDTATSSLIGLFKRLLQRITGLLDQTFQISTRTRDEDAAYLYHATGSASVGAGAWATMASIVVSTGKKLKLVMAEGDFADSTSLTTRRGIRIQQAGTTRAVAHTGAEQPNPDIEGLVLENTSGANETWTVQMFNGAAVASLTMHGWFAFVEVND